MLFFHDNSKINIFNIRIMKMIIGHLFFQLFLMHLDDIIPNVVEGRQASTKQPVGCSSLICNYPGQVNN